VRTDFLAGADRRDLPPGFPAWLALRNLPLPSSGISAADARGARGVSRAVAALLSGDRQPEPDPEERLHGLGRSRREYELLRSRPLSGGLGRPGEVRSGALESAGSSGPPRPAPPAGGRLSADSEPNEPPARRRAMAEMVSARLCGPRSPRL